MNWLDSKIELDPEHYKQIKKTKLEEYIIKGNMILNTMKILILFKKCQNYNFFRYLKKKLQNYIITTLNLNMEKKKKDINKKYSQKKNIEYIVEMDFLERKKEKWPCTDLY